MVQFNRKKRDQDSPHWMTTFSDLMTLLLVFFVLLYSFSIIDVEKFQRFMASFQGTGVLDFGEKPLDKDKDHDYDKLEEDNQELLDNLRKQDPLVEVYLAVQEYIESNDLSTEITVRYSERGVALEIKDKILFASGKAYLKPEARKLLQELSGLLTELTYPISIEGHTDNRPIHNAEFPSNWELSAARAVAVVRHLAETLGMDPKRLSAVGYGEFHPIVPNDSPENMAQNRRVVIVINSMNPNLEKGVE